MWMLNRKIFQVVMLVMLCMFLLACVKPLTIGNPGQIWYLDIQNWTSHQKANFFMDTWMAENANYKAMNAIPNKSKALVDLLKVKREVLENSRIPIRTYASMVNSGGVLDTETERQIIGWIRQLQLQALQGGD